MSNISKKNYNPELIVVEVDHSGRPTVWVAESKENLISIADNSYGLIYEHYTYEKAIDEFGDDIPYELLEILEDHGEAIAAGYHDTIFYYKKGRITKFEAAEEAIAHDNQCCSVMTVEEALQYVEEKPRYSFERKAIEKIKEELKYVV